MDILIVVDMINDFVAKDGSLYIKNSEKLVPVINELINTPNIFPIFANDAHTENDEEFKDFPKHAVKGSWGSQIYDEITMPRTYLILDKKTFSAFSNIDLYGIINIISPNKRVYICGVATEICVASTAFDSKEHGFDTIVMSNAILSLNDINGKIVTNYMESLGIKLVDASASVNK